MIAYKGFDENMRCRGFQFEEGKSYEEKRAELCESGFHACEMPLDVFGYYAPANSIYHQVVLDDVCKDRASDDSKVCAKKIRIGAKLSIAELVKEHVELVLEKAIKNTAATNTGDRSAATVTGMESVAVSIGLNGKAKGAIGCWIVCAEWEERIDGWHRKDVACAMVDGVNIKPDVFYVLRNGSFVEVTDDE